MTFSIPLSAIGDEARRLATIFLAVVFWFTVFLAPLHAAPLVAVPLEVLVVGAFFWYNLHTRAGTRWDPPRRPLPLRVWALLAIVAVVQLPWFAAVQNLYAAVVQPVAMPAPPRFAGPLGAASTIWLVVVIAPLLEEFAFRGWLQAGLQERFGAAAAIPLAAGAWALAHGIGAFPIIFPFGLVVGFIMWTTGSVWPGVLLHVVHNAMPYLPAPVRTSSGRAVEWLVDPGAGPGRMAATLLVSTLFLVLLLAGVARRCHSWAAPLRPPFLAAERGASATGRSA